MKRAAIEGTQAMLARALGPRKQAHARLAGLARVEGAQLGWWQALFAGNECGRAQRRVASEDGNQTCTTAREGAVANEMPRGYERTLSDCG